MKLRRSKLYNLRFFGFAGSFSHFAANFRVQSQKKLPWKIQGPDVFRKLRKISQVSYSDDSAEYSCVLKLFVLMLGTFFPSTVTITYAGGRLAVGDRRHRLEILVEDPKRENR